VVEQLADFMQTSVVPAVRAVTDWFSGLSEPMQTALGVMAGAGATAGPLLVFLGKAATGVNALIGILPTLRGLIMTVWAAGGPISIAIGALTLLVAGGVAVYKNWDTIKAAVQRLGEVVVNHIGRMRDFVVQYITNMRELGQRITQGMIDAIVGFFTGLVDRVLAPVRAVRDGVTGLFSGLRDTLVGRSIVPDMVEDIIGEFEGMATGMEVGSAVAVDGTVGEFDRLTTETGTSMDNALTGIKTKLEGWGIDIPPKVQGVVDGVAAVWKGIEGALNTDLATSLGNAKTQFVQWASDVVSALGSVWSFLSRIAGAIKEAVFGITAGQSMTWGQGQPVTGLPGFNTPDDIFSTQRAVLSGRYANQTFSSGAALQTQLLTDLLVAAEDTAVSNREIRDNTAGLSGFVGTGTGPASDAMFGEDVSRQQRMAGAVLVAR
jgi:phage-related minor tail protein